TESWAKRWAELHARTHKPVRTPTATEPDPATHRRCRQPRTRTLPDPPSPPNFQQQLRARHSQRENSPQEALDPTRAYTANYPAGWAEDPRISREQWRAEGAGLKPAPTNLLICAPPHEKGMPWTSATDQLAMDCLSA